MRRASDKVSSVAETLIIPPSAFSVRVQAMWVYVPMIDWKYTVWLGFFNFMKILGILYAEVQTCAIIISFILSQTGILLMGLENI